MLRGQRGAVYSPILNLANGLSGGDFQHFRTGNHGLLDAIAFAVFFHRRLEFDDLALGRAEGRIPLVNHGVGRGVFESDNPELAEIGLVGIGELDGHGEFDAVTNRAEVHASRDALSVTSSPQGADFVATGNGVQQAHEKLFLLFGHVAVLGELASDIQSGRDSPLLAGSAAGLDAVKLAGGLTQCSEVEVDAFRSQSSLGDGFASKAHRLGTGGVAESLKAFDFEQVAHSSRAVAARANVHVAGLMPKNGEVQSAGRATDIAAAELLAASVPSAAGHLLVLKVAASLSTGGEVVDLEFAGRAELHEFVVGRDEGRRAVSIGAVGHGVLQSGKGSTGSIVSHSREPCKRLIACAGGQSLGSSFAVQFIKLDVHCIDLQPPDRSPELQGWVHCRLSLQVVEAAGQQSSRQLGVVHRIGLRLAVNRDGDGQGIVQPRKEAGSVTGQGSGSRESRRESLTIPEQAGHGVLGEVHAKSSEIQ